MSCKLFLVLSAVICVFTSLEAASVHGVLDKTNAVVQKLDYEGVEANVRSSRQTYAEDDSGEDSDEDDEEDDAELQHQAAIRRQQAYEQSVDNSQEGSDEDSDDNFEEDDDDDFFGRRLKRDVSPSESNNEIEENLKPTSVAAENQEKQPALETASTSSATPSATSSSNTSVLILIRDAIKKVTELPQVATSAQQYFQMFEHFLQQTIEQVIGDDDEEDEVESTTIAAEEEKEVATEISNQSENQPLNETSESSEKKPQDTTEEKA